MFDCPWLITLVCSLFYKRPKEIHKFPPSFRIPESRFPSCVDNCPNVPYGHRRDRLYIQFRNLNLNRFASLSNHFFGFRHIFSIAHTTLSSRLPLLLCQTSSNNHRYRSDLSPSPAVTATTTTTTTRRRRRMTQQQQAAMDAEDDAFVLNIVAQPSSSSSPSNTTTTTTTTTKNNNKKTKKKTFNKYDRRRRRRALELERRETQQQQQEQPQQRLSDESHNDDDKATPQQQDEDDENDKNDPRATANHNHNNNTRHEIHQRPIRSHPKTLEEAFPNHDDDYRPTRNNNNHPVNSNTKPNKQQQQQQQQQQQHQRPPNNHHQSNHPGPKRNWHFMLVPWSWIDTMDHHHCRPPRFVVPRIPTTCFPRPIPGPICHCIPGLSRRFRPRCT